MANETKSYAGLMHAGAGSGLALVQLSALLPGLLPTLALAGVFIVVVVMPLVVLALVVGVLAAPPLSVWLLVSRTRAARRSRQAGEPVEDQGSGPRGWGGRCPSRSC
jgi:hypothetical protein